MNADQDLNITTSMSGMYKFSLERSDGTVEETDWMDNMILNSGLDQLGDHDNQATSLYYLQVGTGTIPVDATQTILQSYLAVATYAGAANLSNSGAPLYQTELIVTYTFPQGTVVGNITEVGVSQSRAAADPLFSRCLITDATGTPTALTVVALDQLTVYYKLTVRPNVTDSAGSFVINNTTYNYVSRPADVQGIIGSVSYLAGFYFSRLQSGSIYDQSYVALSSIDSQPNGAITNATTFSTDPYVVGSYQSKGTLVFDAASCNVPIKGVVSNFAARTQFLFTPAIPKTNTTELRLKFTFSWGRA